MKKCTYCGKEHPDEATVCERDGQPLVDPNAPASPTGSNAATTFGDFQISMILVLVVVVSHLIILAMYGLHTYVVDFNLPVYSLIAGVIPASIAARKGHSFLKWWAFGAALLIIAIPMALIWERKDQPDTIRASTVKQKAINGFIYFWGGISGLFLGEVPQFVTGEDRGLGPFPALLCFISGIVLCWYARKTGQINFFKKS
jgi:hypothetical protein